MKTLSLLLSLSVFAGIGIASAQTQQAPSTSSVPTKLMGMCEVVIKLAVADSKWLAGPIPYSTDGDGGWVGKEKTFKPPVSSMTPSTVAVMDGPFIMWSGKRANYVYAVYQPRPEALVGNPVYFLCKAPANGAAISIIERDITLASPTVASE